MNVIHAAMYTILQRVTRITESHQEQHLKIFRKIGFAQSAAQAKKISAKLNKKPQS